MDLKTPIKATIHGIWGFQPFDGFIAIEERSGGNKRLRVLANDGKSSFVQSDEPAYTMTLSDNAEVATTKLRYTYDSLTTPRITYEVDAVSGKLCAGATAQELVDASGVEAGLVSFAHDVHVAREGLGRRQSVEVVDVVRRVVAPRGQVLRSTRQRLHRFGHAHGLGAAQQ